MTEYSNGGVVVKAGERKVSYGQGGRKGEQPSQLSTSTPRKTKDENSVVVPKSQKSFPLTPQSHLQTSTLVNSIKLKAGKDGVSQKGMTKPALR